jgi:hypothetical protein
MASDGHLINTHTPNHGASIMATKRANTRHISGILQLATEADILEGKEWYDRAYRLVADRSVDLCGHHLSPVQVQAVTWVTYRRLHNVR